MKRCHGCGQEWADKRSPGFREECVKCGTPLHCCANCRFYEATAREWCREPQARAEKPRDPQAGSTCEYFLFGDRGEGPTERERQAKAGLAALFGETPPEPPAETPDWQKRG